MKRLILHIGTHKTGTTAVQAFLKTNAKLLERDAGIFFPVYPAKLSSQTLSRNGHFLHCQSFLRMNGGTQRLHIDEDAGSDEILKMFAKQVKQHDTILLSDEQLWFNITMKNGYLGHLCDILDESGVEQTDIIVYFRRQDEYAESYWKQRVKGFMHRIDSFEEHVTSKGASKLHYLDYARGIKLLERRFGKGHVIVKRYQKSTLVGGDMRYDFADALGIHITDEYVFPEQTDDPRLASGNVSLSNNLTEIMRVGNLSPTFHEKPYKEFRRAACTASLVSPESANKTSLLSSEQRESILARYEEGNAFIAREYFGIEDGVLFEPPKPDIAQWEPDALSLQRDTVLYFTELMARMTNHIDELQLELGELQKAEHSRLTSRLSRVGKRLIGLFTK